MADEIKIDKQVLENRISHFISAWKADKRSGDVLFGGVGSIVIVMGKTEESNSFQKNNAMHVGILKTGLLAHQIFDTEDELLRLMSFFDQFWLLGYEFPATLFVITTEALYIVTTAKKGKPRLNFYGLPLIALHAVQPSIWSP